jgi:hypothetical protein
MPARHVPASGRVAPAGTGYPPPVTGELTTVFAGTIVEVHPAAAAVDVKTSMANAHVVIANAFKALPSSLSNVRTTDKHSRTRLASRVHFPQRAPCALYGLQVVRIRI